MSLATPLAYTSNDDRSPSRLAWHSFCHLVFGGHHRVETLLRKSTQLCSEALKIMYSSPWDNRNVEAGVEILVAVVWLALVEYRTLRPERWLVHNTGMMAIVESIGPAAFANSNRLPLLEALRYGLVTGSILKDVPCPLESDDWLTLPWLQHSSQGWQVYKSTEQKLLDIILQLGKERRNLLALTSPKASIEQEKTAHVNFLVEYHNILQALFDWRSENHTDLCIVDWHLYPMDTEEQQIFPEGVPIFATMIGALMVTWYHTILVILNSLAAYCFVQLTEVQADFQVFSFDHFVRWLQLNGHRDQHDLSIWFCFYQGHADDDNNDKFPKLGTYQETRQILWLMLAEQSLDRACSEANEACSAVSCLLNISGDSVTTVHAHIALVPVMNTLGDTLVGQWARRASTGQDGRAIAKIANEQRAAIAGASWPRPAR